MSTQGRTTTEQLLEADRRQPDVATFASGVSSASQHTALRASVRQLGTLLGEALTRHEGPELLALVEKVRGLAREPEDDELRALLEGVDAPTAVVLARAFTAYFQLVNVTEQLHRWRELSAVEQTPLAATVGRIGAALEAGTLERDELETILARLEYRPVFTAHPTEATRRTVLNLLRRIAVTVDELEDPRRPVSDGPRAERRLAELVDMMWQTDELRIVRPEPTDEARTAMHTLRFLADQVVPDLLAELDRTLAGIGVEHDAGLAELVEKLDHMLHELSSSTRFVDVTDAMRESLDRDAQALPVTYAAVRRLNAEEPYRLKLSFVRVRLLRTRDRLTHGTPHEPGRDYAGFDELLDDLVLMRESMLAAGDTLTADGAILRLIRAAVATGTGLATLDVREHSAKHHAAPADLYDRLGELDTPYGTLDHPARIDVLSR